MAGGRATALSLCVQAVGCGLTGLAVQFSDESALEVCNTWYALYKSTFLPFFLFLRSISLGGEGNVLYPVLSSCNDHVMMSRSATQNDTTSCTARHFVP